MFDRKFGWVLVLFLAIALAASGISPALAGSATGGEAQGMASLGALLKASMQGVAPDQVRVTRLDNGLTKMVVPTAGAGKGGELIARMAKPLTMLCLVHELFEPDLFAETVSFDFAPIDDFPYFYGWVVLNNGDVDLDKKTTVTRKGPGDDIRLVDTVTYDANSFILFFLEDPGAAPGLHKYQVKVATAKKLFANICSGCAG